MSTAPIESTAAPRASPPARGGGAPVGHAGIGRPGRDARAGVRPRRARRAGSRSASATRSPRPTSAPRSALLPAAARARWWRSAQWVAEARTGATVGSAVVGIRTVSPSTGRPAGLLAILVRQLVVGAGALACLVGQWVVVASGAWDPARRSAAGTTRRPARWCCAPERSDAAVAGAAARVTAGRRRRPGGVGTARSCRRRPRPRCRQRARRSSAGLVRSAPDGGAGRRRRHGPPDPSSRGCPASDAAPAPQRRAGGGRR